MQRLKTYIIISVILISLFLLLGPGVYPENFQFWGIFNSKSQEDVIIIFNSGGWGNTPPEKAEDLTPIIRGIEKTLADRGYESIVVPYERTKNSFLGRIEGAKELFNFFQKQSKELAQGVEFFLENNPGKKIIIVGLSNGATFVDETMQKIDEFQNSVLAIEIGAPFWQRPFNSDNILRLDNENKDPLVKGEAKVLVASLFKAPIKWLSAKISGSGLTLPQALKFPGHKYSWESSEVNPQIASFLEAKLIPSDF